MLDKPNMPNWPEAVKRAKELLAEGDEPLMFINTMQSVPLCHLAQLCRDAGCDVPKEFVSYENRMKRAKRN